MTRPKRWSPQYRRAVEVPRAARSSGVSTAAVWLWMIGSFAVSFVLVVVVLDLPVCGGRSTGCTSGAAVVGWLLLCGLTLGFAVGVPLAGWWLRDRLRDRRDR